MSGHVRQTKPQVTPHSLFRPRPTGQPGAGSSPHRLPRAVRALANEAVVTKDGPHPTVRVEPTARPGTRRHPRRPCHKRAIHSSPERSRADNHGQPRSSFDLRRSPSSRVTAAPDLALGAGDRLVEACIGLAVSGRPIWSLVAEDPSASGVRRRTTPEPAQGPGWSHRLDSQPDNHHGYHACNTPVCTAGSGLSTANQGSVQTNSSRTSTSRPFAYWTTTKCSQRKVTPLPQ
jgi:hypothetical protein